MSDIELVLDDLFRARRTDTDDELRPDRVARSIHRLSDGVFRLAYGDDEEQVFLLTLQSVASRRIEPAAPQPIGKIDGVQAQLVAVVVDTHVHIELDLGESRAKALLLKEYRQAFEQWLATWPTDEGPPDEPAARLRAVTVKVTDDVGTNYTYDSGTHGGTGRECHLRLSFRPEPPTSARQLRVLCQAPGDQEWIAEFDLHDRHDDAGYERG